MNELPGDAPRHHRRIEAHLWGWRWSIAWLPGKSKGGAAMPRLLARIARWRPVPADRVHDFAVHPLLALHMHRNQRMRRGHQQQNMENQPENQAKHDQDEVEDRRERLPVEKQAK